MEQIMHDLSIAELGKFISAKVALAQVKNGMKLGLGTGSTAAWLVRLLAHDMRHNGLTFEACATSRQTTRLAQSLGIKIHSLDALGQLDLAIDGADEFDPMLNLIKGGGGALLQEKIVESAADRLIVITDRSKQVAQLGGFALPVEVVQFGWQTTYRMIKDALGALGYGPISITRRGGDAPFISDEGHYILDLEMVAITDLRALSDRLLSIPGVVETGLFLDMCDQVIMGDGAGSVQSKSAGQNWSHAPFDLGANHALITAVKG